MSKAAGKMVSVLVVSGVEGPSIYINDYRVAGSKPWGGSRTLVEFNVPIEKIREQLDKAEQIAEQSNGS